MTFERATGDGGTSWHGHTQELAKEELTKIHELTATFNRLVIRDMSDDARKLAMDGCIDQVKRIVDKHRMSFEYIFQSKAGQTYLWMTSEAYATRRRSEDPQSKAKSLYDDSI